MASAGYVAFHTSYTKDDEARSLSKQLRILRRQFSHVDIILPDVQQLFPENTMEHGFVLKEATETRNEQLTELENLFGYLEEHRSLQGYEGEKSARYEAVQLIYRELTSVYKQSDIDWKIIHDAGCTRDDTDLPDHVTSRTDIDRLITVTFRSFLTALPNPPTIVTIARSSEDDYCPAEDVDLIQVGVLEELRQRIGDIDIQLSYQQEETF